MKLAATIKRLALSKYVYALVFVAGAVAFSYPLMMELINSQTQTRIISSYKTELDKHNEVDIAKMLEEAEVYNQFVERLEGNVTDPITEEEQELLSGVDYENVYIVGSETLGYVTIPKIDVELPLYKGTSDAVLNRGVGHLERSSLPVGGENTHSVLLAHRGLPTSRLFRDLNLLEKGDVFLVHSLDTTLAYEVESSMIILPTEVEFLQIQKGRDLCTLVTCEPYMINSHRLLVTGHRIDYDPTAFEGDIDGHISLFQKYWEYFLVGGISAFIAWLLILFTRKRMKKKNRLKNND
ncbi:MAG: class C sortase [Eggerthellaceae bacterium]|nr:class C sortase [Eggerthellaceae bacterium]